ncbi:MAG: very short patch repair endonuclease [Pseudomonadota bacterium]
MDIVSKDVRSRMMAGIRAKNTRPELTVRRLLHAAGVRYRLHRKDLPGAPDIVLPKYQAVIFVHGCFWHQHQGCALAKMPASNRAFWETKLLGNRERDRASIDRLRAQGWRVLTVWECATRDASTHCQLQTAIVEWIKSARPILDIGAILPPFSARPS